VNAPSSTPTQTTATATHPGEPATPIKASKGSKMQRNIHGSPFGYETHGEGRPIVFLHGLPNDRRSVMPRFEPMFSATGSKWRRIYPDLPGAGETPANAAIKDFDSYVATVNAFIDEEAAGQRTTLVGVSWGAYFAAAYALKHPERVAGLALIVPGLGPSEEAVRPPRKVLVTEPGALDGAHPMVVGMMNAAATVHSRRIRELFERDVVPGGKAADHGFLTRVLSTRLSYHKELRALSIDVPALVLAGKQDSMDGYIEAGEMAQHLPRATYAVIDRAGHALAGEQTELVTAHVREWLARVNEGLGGSYEQPGL